MRRPEDLKRQHAPDIQRTLNMTPRGTLNMTSREYDATWGVGYAVPRAPLKGMRT